mmetsp:Transcript_89302/g.257540  ORF Transcript_89302/g.257540 Transcript_89302/m.257540 type:complete len:124 (-) Transcript_89302:7-378(-)
MAPLSTTCPRVWLRVLGAPQLPTWRSTRNQVARSVWHSIYDLTFLLVLCFYLGLAEHVFETPMLSDCAEAIPRVVDPRPTLLFVLLVLIAVFMHAAFRSFYEARKRRMRKLPVLKAAPSAACS